MAKKSFLIFLLLAAILVAASSFLFWKRTDHLGSNLKKIIKAQNQKFLYSSFMNEESYDNIFSDPFKERSVLKIKAGVVPHHFLAKELIADLYGKIGSEEISQVFLVSPDHFNNFFGQGTVAYSSFLPWKTPFGDIYADEQAVGRLVGSKKVKISDSIIGLEHGISVEAPFIKRFFPNAKIVPIAVKNLFSYDDFFALGKEIKNISNENSVLIISSDFSHNLSADEAAIRDAESIKILEGLPSADPHKVANDCQNCIAVLSGFLDGQRSTFSLVGNKDSFYFSGQDKDSVTSYVSGYYYEP